MKQPVIGIGRECPLADFHHHHLILLATVVVVSHLRRPRHCGYSHLCNQSQCFTTPISRVFLTAIKESYFIEYMCVFRKKLIFLTDTSFAF